MMEREKELYSQIEEMRSLVEARNDRIEELEAALTRIHDELMTRDKIVTLAYAALKGEEAETPERPSTDDQVPPREKYVLKASKASLFLLQADFQEHKLKAAQDQRWAEDMIQSLRDEIHSIRQRLYTLEQCSQAASQNVSYRYSDRCEEESDPNPASPVLGARTLEQPPALEPNETWKAGEGETIETEPPRDRRTGKDRRVLSSAKRPDGDYYGSETMPFPTRRKISRQKSDSKPE